jgi:MOSC domain-containing protein YiiM
MSTMQKLMDTLPQQGRVVWIGLRPAPQAPINVVDDVNVTEEQGLEGDRYKSRSRKRQVTLIQGEHLDAVASMLGVTAVDPALIRRNIVVRGINLLALKGRVFTVGGTTLEFTELCHPCSRMEANLGAGGYNAMRGHGGITARVLAGGRISLGDAVAAKPGPVGAADSRDLNPD